MSGASAAAALVPAASGELRGDPALSIPLSCMCLLLLLGCPDAAAACCCCWASRLAAALVVILRVVSAMAAKPAVATVGMSCRY